MPNNDKKKPAKAADAKAAANPNAFAKSGAIAAGQFYPGQTKPTDAGRTSANTGGKGASSKKGR